MPKLTPPIQNVDRYPISDDSFKKAMVLGRVIDPTGGSPGSLFLIDGNRDGRRIACDATGSFKINLGDRRKVKLAIERDGIVVSQIEFDPTTIAGELLIEVPPRPILQEDPVSIAIRSIRPSPIQDDVVNRLRALITKLEIDEKPIGEVGRMLDEIEEISDLALSALSGDATALLHLRSGFEREIPFNFDLDLARFKPAPNNFGIDPCRAVPHSPWAIVMAGIMLDAGKGTVWAGKAVSAILRRSEPAVRVIRALSGFEVGQVGEDMLRDALFFATDVSERGSFQTPLWELFSDQTYNRPPRLGLSPRPGPFDPGGFLGEFDEHLARSRFRTLIDPCNLEWLECVNTIIKSPPQKTPKPPFTVIDKTDVLEGQTTEIRLSPRGGSFENIQNPDWIIVFSGNTIVPRSWSSNEIVLDIPANVQPGCHKLMWIVFDNLAGFFNQQSDACARYFGNNRPIIPIITHIQIGNVSVVGQPSIVFFTAGGVAPKLLAEGCKAVEIAWSVDRCVCSNSASTFDVNITDNKGQVLFRGLTPQGRLSVSEPEDRTYTLTAHNTLDSVVSPPAGAVLEVERYLLKAIQKISPPGLVRAGSEVVIEVEISCPADEPVIVDVSSDEPGRCPGLTISIPVGQTKATNKVKAGTETGRVTLTCVESGIAVNQVPVSVSFEVNNPTFETVLAANLKQCDGGSVTVRMGGSTSVSTVELSGPSGLVPGMLISSIISSPKDPASGTIQVTAKFGSLTAGTYTVQVQADGMMLMGDHVMCTLDNPSITSSTATPNAVSVCVLTSVTLKATSQRATELLITRIDGTVVGGPVQGGNPCKSLNVIARVQLKGKERFRVIAKRQGAMTAEADVTVGEMISANAISKVTLFNNMNEVTTIDSNGNVSKTRVTLYIYKVSQRISTRLGQITSQNGKKVVGQSVFEYTPSECELFDLYALRKDFPPDDPAILTEDKLFPNQTHGVPTHSFVGHSQAPAREFTIRGN